jgi:hypothetical protein
MAIQEAIEALPDDVLLRHLGGEPLTYTCQVAFNGMALSATALNDSGANCDIIIDKKLAARMEDVLGAKRRKVARPKTINGYDGRSRQVIDTVITAHLKIQGRIDRNVLFIVASINQDLLIGRKWYARNDVIIDVPRRRLLFPGTWGPEQVHDILMNQAGKLLTDPAYEEDRRRRDALMDEEIEREDQERRERRRRDQLTPDAQRQLAQRIYELEAMRRAESAPTRKKVRFVLPEPDNAPSREPSHGWNKMNRQLAGRPRSPPPPPTLLKRPAMKSEEETYWNGEVQKDSSGRRYILKQGFCGPYISQPTWPSPPRRVS